MLKILFLSNRPSPGTQASTVEEYLNAIGLYSKHKIYEVSMLHHFPERLDLDLFDVVITHYSLSLGPLMEHYLGKSLIKKLRRFKGLKVAFLQDEYRAVNVYWDNFNLIGLDLLFSCVPHHEIPKVYPKDKVPNLTIVNVLTGYVPTKLTKMSVLPIADRKIDVGYRTRDMPFWLGKLAYEKSMISREFSRLSVGSNLVLDLSTSESDRLYGDEWVRFVSSCKALLGVESGASIIDFDGSIEKSVDAHVAKNPDASFCDVHSLLLKGVEGSIDLAQISPRCFEAAALRTPMVLFEGKYSGILEPDKHFICLKKDFSNIASVQKILRNNSVLQRYADQTYEDIALNSRWSYAGFVSKVDEEIEKKFLDKNRSVVESVLEDSAFKKIVNTSLRYQINRSAVLYFQSLFLGNPIFRKMLFTSWELIPQGLRKYVRPLARLVSR
jgi:hypothetical protein